ASRTLTRSTWAASPMSPSTRGIAPRTSAASSSRRLARAVAVRRRSRPCRDSLIAVSFSAHGAASPSTSSRATVAFMSDGTRSALSGRSESLARRARDLPLLGDSSILRGSEHAASALSGLGPRAAASGRIKAREPSGIKSLASGLSDIARRGCHFPAASEGLVHGDEGRRGLRARPREAILGRELRALGVEHFEKVDQAALVAGARDARRGEALLRCIGGVLQALARARMGDERILGLLERPQHRLLVAGEGDVGARVALGDPGLHAP